MSETTIGTVLARKESEIVWTINSDARVCEAAAAMARHKIGALVVEDAGKVCGLISERECTRRVIALHLSAEDTRVREIMEKTLIGVSPSATVEQCFSIMTEYRVRHVAVIDNNSIIGIISIGDVVRSVIKDQENDLFELERYLHGPYCAWNVPVSATWSPGQVQVVRCNRAGVSAPRVHEVVWGSESFIAANG